MYGSQSELLAQGVDPKQLLGLMSDTDTQEDKDQFSVHVQDVGMCVSVVDTGFLKEGGGFGNISVCEVRAKIFRDHAHV